MTRKDVSDAIIEAVNEAMENLCLSPANTNRIKLKITDHLMRNFRKWGVAFWYDPSDSKIKYTLAK